MAVPNPTLVNGSPIIQHQPGEQATAGKKRRKNIAKLPLKQHKVNGMPRQEALAGAMQSSPSPQLSLIQRPTAGTVAQVPSEMISSPHSVPIHTVGRMSYVEQQRSMMAAQRPLAYPSPSSSASPIQSPVQYPRSSNNGTTPPTQMMSAQLQAVHIGPAHLATNEPSQRQQWPSNGIGPGGVGRSEGIAHVHMKNFAPLPSGHNFTSTCGNVEQRMQQSTSNPHLAFKPTIAGRAPSGAMTSPQKPSYQQFSHPPQHGIVQPPQSTQSAAGHSANDFPTTYQPAMEQHHQPQRLTFAGASNVSILTPPSSNPQSNGSIESGGLQHQLPSTHDFKDTRNPMHTSTAEYELENWGATGDLTTVQTTDLFDFGLGFGIGGINHNGVRAGDRWAKVISI